MCMPDLVRRSWCTYRKTMVPYSRHRGPTPAVATTPYATATATTAAAATARRHACAVHVQLHRVHEDSPSKLDLISVL